MKIKFLKKNTKIVLLVCVLFILGALLGALIVYGLLVKAVEKKIYFYDPRNKGQFSNISLEKEPDDSFQKANMLTPGYKTQGSFTTAQDVDMYVFDLNLPSNVQIALENTPQEYNLFVYDSNRFLVASSERAGFFQSTSVLSLEKPGKYYIKLVGKSQGQNNGTNPYTITLTIIPHQE